MSDPSPVASVPLRVRCWYGAPLPAPNPQRVRVFLAEKKMSIPEITVNLINRDQKKMLDKNPVGQVPILEFEDGACISESVSICRFLEEENPEVMPKLFGSNALEKALIDQWIRRVEFVLMMPMGAFWVHAHPYTERLPIKKFVEYGQHNKVQVVTAMNWFDKNMKHEYLAGSKFSMADIALLSSVDFAKFIGIPIPDDCSALLTWRARVENRNAEL